MSPLKPVTLYTRGQRPWLFERRSLLLSASVPYGKKGLPTSEAKALNRHHVATSRPARIREAISYLCRFAFQRDLNLVFGAHPAIAPMVLAAARLFAPLAGQKRVVVFQSAFFQFEQIPRETLELADWSCGELLWTKQASNRNKPDRALSLTHMREEMVQVPNLIGAIFIGGMEGVEEESQLFKRHQPGKPRYALGSTGSAAADLLRSAPGAFCGYQKHVDEPLLAREQSYPRLFRRILEDLGLP